MSDDERRERNLATARRLLDAMGRMAVDEMIAEYADDVALELPYAPGSMQRAFIGKDAAAGFMHETQGHFSSYENTVDTIFATHDPDAVVAEVRGHGIVAANGRPYEQSYVIFLRFAPDGRLRLWREYYNPGVVIKAFGK